MLSEIEEKLTALEFILTEIIESPHGAWNNDPVTYLENVIKWCQDRAREGLKVIHGSASSPSPNQKETE